jgi:hypothetical protein
MMRQYRTGNKFPILEKLNKLEFAIKEMAEELKSIKLSKTKTKRA